MNYYYYQFCHFPNIEEHVYQHTEFYDVGVAIPVSSREDEQSPEERSDCKLIWPMERWLFDHMTSKVLW